MIDLVDYEGYAITESGQVWSYPKPLTGILKNKGYTKGKWLKQSVSTNGYKSINLGSNNRNISVHRLVASAHLDRVEGKDIVNHIDGNKLNNDYRNLEWCTHSENAKHAFNTGLRKRGLKLSRSQIEKAKKLLSAGLNQVQVGIMLNVGSSTISRAINGVGYEAG